MTDTTVRPPFVSAQPIALALTEADIEALGEACYNELP